MNAERRFATGQWYAVAGDSVTVVLPASDRGRVAALWELADSGATTDALLDALLAGGVSALESFALVGEQDGVTRVIVRGTPTATVVTASGEQAITAAPGTTWNEQVLAGVTGGRVDLEGDGPADHVLTPGLARVSVLEFGSPVASESAAPAEAEVAPTPVAAEVPVEDLVEEPAEAPPVTDQPAEPEIEAPIVAPTPEFFPEPTPEPVAPELAPVPEPYAPAAADLSVEEPLSFGEPEADPTPTGETPAVTDDLPAGPPADDWSDRDGQTIIGAPTPDFDRPPIPGQEMAPHVVSRPVASLVFSTGDLVEVDRTVLIGRAPEARQFASHDQPHAVTVSSPNQEISSTHLEIRPGAGADHGSAIATDLGSTNGTILVQPGLAPEELKPGIAVSLIPGAVLDLGDGVTIQVTNP